MVDARGNRRVERLLNAAYRHGREVTQGRVERICSSDQHPYYYVISGGGYTLTLYPGARGSLVVMCDGPGAGQWQQITQRNAGFIIACSMEGATV